MSREIVTENQICEALYFTNGNMSRAAKLLGISKQGIFSRIQNNNDLAILYSKIKHKKIPLKPLNQLGGEYVDLDRTGLVGWGGLMAAIIWQAKLDYDSNISCAKEFLVSDYCADMCEYIGYDHELILDVCGDNHKNDLKGNVVDGVGA